MTGRYGVACPYDTEPLSSTSHPRAMRPHELEEEPGFPDTGLAHHRGELAAAGAGLLERAVKVLDLGVASDEPAERPCRHRLQPPPDRPGSRDLEDLDGIVHALDRHRTE